MTILIQQWDQFIDSYQTYHRNQQGLKIEYDSQWPSPCYCNSAADGEIVNWLPVKRDVLGDFADLAKALEINFPEALSEVFGRYWSDNLTVRLDESRFDILQPWNEEDFARLQHNLIGHVLMKRRLKQPDTLFFGLAEDEDWIVSLDVASGRVMLERVGMVPTQELAPDMLSFIRRLQPV